MGPSRDAVLTPKLSLLAFLVWSGLVLTLSFLLVLGGRLVLLLALVVSVWCV